jgi:hypothetical protein
MRIDPIQSVNVASRNPSFFCPSIALLILIPLILWSLFFMIPEIGFLMCYSKHFSWDLQQWIKEPSHGFPFLLWVIMLIYHGMQSLERRIHASATTSWTHLMMSLVLKSISGGLIALSTFCFYWLWLVQNFFS